MSLAHRIHTHLKQHRAAFYAAGLLSMAADLYALAKFGVI